MLNTLGYFSFMYVNFLLLTWTPKYLQDNFGYSLSSLWYMGMILDRRLRHRAAGRPHLRPAAQAHRQPEDRARSWFAAGCLLATALCFMLVSQAQSVFAVIALMTLANALNALPNSVYWAVVIDTAPASRVGTFSGLMHFSPTSRPFSRPR